MSTIPGFNALMAQAYANPTTDIENQQRRAQTNLLQTQQQAEQARIPLVQAQTQQAQIQNQLAQQGLRDNGILRQAYAQNADADWSDPATSQNFERGLIQKGISYQGLAGYRQEALKWSQGLLGYKEKDLEIEEKLNQRTSDILDNYGNIPDAQKPQIWAQVTAPALNRLHQGQFDPNNPLVGVALDSVVGVTKHHKAMLDDAKTLQETATSAANARKATAEAERAEYVNGLLKQGQQAAQTPQSGVHPIDAILSGLDPNDPMRASLRAMYDRGMQIVNPNNPQEHPVADHAMETAANYAHEVARANNPQIRQGEVNKAVETERATSPIKTQTGINTKVGELQAEAKLAPGGFANITDQRERARAEGDYDKFSQEYADKAASVQELSDLLGFVNQGNKSAAGRIPMSQVRQYTSRFNRQELEAVGPGAGNALDRVNAFMEHNFSKSGADFSPEVLKDLATVNQAMENAAYRSYGQKVDVLNQEHGLSGERAVKPVNRIQLQHNAPEATPTRPVSIPRGSRAQYNPATKQWRYSTDGGQTWQIAKGG